jgi:hypothetical protein
MSETKDSSRASQKRAIDEVNGRVVDATESKRTSSDLDKQAVVVAKRDPDALEKRTSHISLAYEQILTQIGENTSRDGLIKTPARAAKAFLHFTKGYHEVLKGNLIRLQLYCWTCFRLQFIFLTKRRGC